MTPACAPEQFCGLAEVRSITGLSTAAYMPLRQIWSFQGRFAGGNPPRFG